MKKALLPFILCFCFLVSIFSGCSCSDPESLNFNKNFSGNSSFQKETLTYSIKYEKTSSLDFSSSFSEGIFKTTLEVLTSTPVLPNSLVSDIPAKVSSNTTFYKFSTEMSIPVSYTIKGNTTSHIDTVSSLCYMCESDLSLAPIYSYTKSDYLIYNYTESTSSVEEIISSCETVYNSSQYTMTSTIYDLEGSEKDKETRSYDYIFKTIIDNSQLLFALRNFDIPSSSSNTILTVSRNYGSAIELIVKNTNTRKEDFSISLNNKGQTSTFAEKISFNEFEFYINNASSSGSAQTVFIQKDAGENTPFNSYMLYYKEPLIAYGSFTIMGALTYKLSAITIE